MAAIARWLQSAWMSKIRFCSLPRSMAMTTARWVEFSGVITRCGRDAKRERVLRAGPDADAAAEAQFLVQDGRSSCLGRWGSLAETRPRASTGQTSTHLPQPVQAASPDHRHEVARVHRVEEAETAGGDQGLAAAAAAIADEIDRFAHVLAELHESLRARA